MEPATIKYECKWGEPDPTWKTKPSKVYKINMDLPAKDRWNEIITDNHDIIMQVIKEASEEIPLWLAKLTPTSWIRNYHPKLFEEIEALSELLKLDIGIVFWMNMLYELYTYCTSIITQDKKGNIYHGRNLDWDMRGGLANMYHVVEFHHQGKLLYKGHVVPGCLGILSGVKPGAFALSINQKECEDIQYESIWQLIKGAKDNAIEALWHKKLGCQLLARRVLEEANTYEDAIEMIAQTPIIAPCYFIISGIKKNEGAVLTKNRNTLDEMETLNIDKEKWYLVQTNYDRRSKDPENDNRRTFAEKQLDKIGRDTIEKDKIWGILKQYPSLNQLTIVTALFSAQKDLLESQVWIEDEKKKE